MGVLSYGMYLWHMLAVGAVTAALGRAHLPMQLLFPVALALTLLLAELSYRYYEVPFLKMKRRFSR